MDNGHTAMFIVAVPMLPVVLKLVQVLVLSCVDMSF